MGAVSAALAVTTGIDRRAIRAGLFGATLLAAGYSLIIGLSSRSLDHLRAQWRTDAPFIAFVLLGFGVQMGLFSHLRRVIRGDGAAAAVTAGSAATSTAAMVACCLHHLNDVVPLLGVSGAAAFLLEYKVPVILLSLGANGLGIVHLLRSLRHVKRAASAATAAAPVCH